jgi:hypothetical protein
LRMPPSQPRVSPRSYVSACSRNDIHRQVSRTMARIGAFSAISRRCSARGTV